MAGLINSGTSADFGCGDQMGETPAWLRKIGNTLDDAISHGIDTLVEQGQIVVRDAAGNIIKRLVDTPANREYAKKLAEEKAATEAGGFLLKNQKYIIAGAGVIAALLVLNMFIGRK